MNEDSANPANSDPSASALAQPAQNAPRGLAALTALFDKWHVLVAALGALLAAAANVKLFIEQEWQFATLMLVLCVLGVALHALSARTFTSRRYARMLRLGAAVVLTSVPIVTTVAFYYLAVAPRTNEDGPIIAIARFQGPKLPPPYDDCRPSDMLVDKLSDVAHRYAHLNAFELPYTIEPNGRWASTWAWGHGLLEGTDTVVFGEYSFVADGRREGNPDRIRISPEVDQVPLLALGPKVTPLQAWEFPDRVVRIDELCTGHAQRFLQDGKRLALALVGLEAFARQQYVSAERALAEAEQSHAEAEAIFAHESPPDDARCDSGSPGKSQCSGVLAFYLAALEQRMGHYALAEREYAFAAAKLNRPAPFIDLAELYALENKGPEAIRALNSAQSADPNSIIAAATRAQYEYEYGQQDYSAVVLAAAKRLAQVRVPAASEYEQIVLCRAVYVRDRDAGLACRANVPQSGFANSTEAHVENARWLIASARPERIAEGISELRHVLDVHPNHIKANYTLARTLADLHAPDRAEIAEHYRIALNARAFTDDEFTDQGNAAAELKDPATARDRYAKALLVNPRFAYAYANRGTLYNGLGDARLASRDFQMAAALHPRESSLPGAQAISDAVGRR